MAAREIARVVQDLRDGRIAGEHGPDAVEKIAAVASWATLVDVTAIHRDVIGRTTNTYPYEDHPCIAPPWDGAVICFENTFGNVYALLTISVPWEPGRKRWDDDKGIDWDSDVRWVIHSHVFVGGRNGEGKRLPTTGPMVRFKYAVGHDGEPLDLHWEVTHPNISDISEMQIPQLVLLETLQFMSCRNVEIVEPVRPNHVRKHLARAGMTLNELHVFPSGKTSRSKGAKSEPLGSVHAPVRGHFASYGPKYGRGLLFGKIEGRFFIPPHVRGSKDVGESVQEVTVHTEP